jgi:shikimate dehydrogenase|tara:strand:- start:9655 stop:10548 length:894 start_codon:yes stop_codon:yes gene_type:complete
MLEKINNLTTNSVDVDFNSNYAFIVGVNPSEGARSPLLWNAVFSDFGSDMRMFSLDVISENLELLLDELNADSNCIGGCVAVPYKERVFKWLGENTTRETLSIGAVNSLYRHDGELFGTNTDGEGAIQSFKKNFNITDRKTLILGAGGTSRAVASYWCAEGAGDNVVVCNRTDSKAQLLASCIGAKWIEWEKRGCQLKETEVIVNCTSSGTGEFISESPLTVDELKQLPVDGIVFDVNYAPNPTLLLSNAKAVGVDTLNGSEMNLEQAVLAMNYAVDGMSVDNIRLAMTKKYRELAS